MLDNRSTRDGFGDSIHCFGENRNVIVLSADLAKATRVDKFKSSYPDRFIDCGIAESNMIGVSSGIAENGFRVFCTSFASFLTGRYDQIRCSIAYPSIPVVLVGTHSGMAIGRDGVTQMGLEDINIMRGLPGMEILQPDSYNDAYEMTKYLITRDLDHPVYFRLGRQPVNNYLNIDESHLHASITPIRPIIECHSTPDVVIFYSGCMHDECISVADLLYRKINVYNISRIKPLSYKDIIECCKCELRHALIVTVEDHSVIGGIGSLMSEIMSENKISDFGLLRIGLNDIFPESGRPEDLYDKYGLTDRKIANNIEACLNAR